METLHSVTDRAKVARIAASIERDGWLDVPLVADGELLLTGVHRYAAWRQLDRPNYELPVIDIRDLFLGAGLDDYDAMLAAEMDGIEYEVALPFVLKRLPAPIREKFGIDIE